jgi:hypothetical protein
MLLKLLIGLCMLFAVALSLEKYSTDLAGRCETCRGIVTKFKQGLVKSAKSNFGGGNTQWEEKNLGSYAFSETRLLEILEHVCDGDSARECHHMLESKEEVIENWWFKHYAKGVDTDLFTYLCVSRMKVCCPNGTFGMDCRDCDGGRAKPCKGNGQCVGDGTRSGTGSCTCNVGYTGQLCDACIDGFFEDSKDSGRIVCRPCHGSCKLTCSEAGPLGCDDCRDGWTLSDDNGCVDENECEDEMICEENEFCLNTEGSYKCLVCNKACQTCSGSTASDCTKCASKHYRDVNGVCRPCHVSCVSSCSDDTSESCDMCDKGWIQNTVNGACQDVDECSAVNRTLCDVDEYCVNTVGSYKCATCHPSCVSCTSAGNDHCIECKPGFAVNSDGQCVDIDECTSTADATVCNKPHERCTNTPGSYRCFCETGYVLADDGSCQLQSNVLPNPSNTKSSPNSAGKKTTSTETKSKLKMSSNTKVISDVNKKTTTTKAKTAKQKEREKKYRETAYGYLAGLVGFLVVGSLLKNHILMQSVTTLTYTVYLTWLSNVIDRSVVRRS